MPTYPYMYFSMHPFETGLRDRGSYKRKDSEIVISLEVDILYPSGKQAGPDSDNAQNQKHTGYAYHQRAISVGSYATYELGIRRRLRTAECSGM